MSYWYKSLVPGESGKSLLEKHTIHKDTLVVCRQRRITVNNESMIVREYKPFSNFVNFIDFFINVPLHEKTFYEIILDRPQKIYFDIDDNFTVQDLIIVRDEIIKMLKEFGMDNFWVMIFDSNNDDKISYHIVVDGVYVGSCKENKHFYNLLLARINISHPESIDEKVYKRIQQYRIPFCTKIEKNRFKKLSIEHSKMVGNYELIEPVSERHYLIQMFKSSLVTTTEGSRFLYLELPQHSRIFNSVEGFIDVNDEEIEKIKKMYEKTTGQVFSDFFKIERDTISDENCNCFIPIKRLGPSFCNACQRSHESENPFFLICTEQKNVYFDCRRGKNRIFLGKLNAVEIVEKEKIGFIKNFIQELGHLNRNQIKEKSVKNVVEQMENEN